MTTETKKNIPFHVEINRVIELLAKQIYQSPLALIRENCQNAFDAVLMRLHQGDNFEPRIEVNIAPNEIAVKDNGIGMSCAELEQHFWRAGSSGKNSAEARAAGVVGTFGIGAMANFGVAEELIVVTESLKNPERTISIANRSTLSATNECISLESVTPLGQPGTIVTAKIQDSMMVNIAEASNYLREIIKFLDIPVFLNGQLISKLSFEQHIPRPFNAWAYNEKAAAIGKALKCNIEVISSANGELWAMLSEITFMSSNLPGTIILKQGMHQIQTFRSKFSLANSPVSTVYGFGGIANLMNLEPTAGREALTTNSLQILQTIVTEVERFISERFADSDYCDQNLLFMQWVLSNSRIDLCKKLKVRTEPSEYSMSLGDLSKQTNNKAGNYYDGSDQSIIRQYSSNDNPLIIIATRNPRKNCELQYITQFCKMNRIQNTPQVLSRKDKKSWTMDESSFAFRLAAILGSDYFLETEISFGQISHGLPLLVNGATKPVEIVIDSSAHTLSAMLQLYKNDVDALTSLAKDFIRTSIFPHISNLVPSSTRQGAEAFLRAVKRPRDFLEYEYSDLGTFSTVWQDYLDGKISLSAAAEKSVSLTRRNVQVFDRSAATNATNVIPDVLQNEQMLQNQNKSSEEDLSALPAITRLSIEADAKLLLINDSEPALKGYRCFVAISDRARQERGDFFIQPHFTEVVWGGQKAIYIFHHHSREFALYYELQAQEIFSPTPGGHAYPTCSIIVKNQLYIPVPEDIKAQFIPTENVGKRFEIRCELLYPDVFERKS